MSLIIVIGRGHSGTRVIAHTLYGSGVFMGKLINPSGDKVPAAVMYRACRRLGPHVKWDGGVRWDFSALHQMEIDARFRELLDDYLEDLFRRDAPVRGWKLPETTLAFPWIARLFPDASYVHWVRDPRDCIARAHHTDDLRRFQIEAPETDDLVERRAISWRYQYDIVESTPRPARFLTVRYEDMIREQERTLARLEEFLGMKLARIVTRSAPIGRHRAEPGRYDFEFLRAPLAALGYVE